VNRRLAALLVALPLLAGACSDDKPTTEPSETPSPSISVSPSPSPEQLELGRLAGLAAVAKYDASYRFVESSTKKAGILRIVALAPYFRLDVTTDGTTAIFLTSPNRTVSCSVRGTKKSCFLAARKGEKVPDLFDPGLQRLFSDAVKDLAANPLNYAVTSSPNFDLPGKLPTGKCFAVDKAPGAPGGSGPEDPTGFETGRYCFSPGGLLTHLSVETGRITMMKISPTPDIKDFNAPAPVKSLPPLPSPTPSKSASPTASASGSSPSTSASASPSSS
jgi:hypothetical protein